MLWARLLICGTLVYLSGTAGPIGLARLDKLVEQASHIVVATVREGNQSGKSASLVLDVHRSIKGSVGQSLTVEAQLSEEFASTRSLKGITGIWFLAVTDSRTYQMLPAMVGSIPLEFGILPALPNMPDSWVPGPAASAAERLVREVAAAQENGLGFPAIMSEFLTQKQPGIKALGTVYRRMTLSREPTVVSAGIAGLIRSGDPEGLTLLKTKANEGFFGATNSIGQAVCEYTNAASRGILLLGEITQTTQRIARLQECAAFALRNIHSRETIPFLIPLLESNNVNLRYEAVAGLASYANSGFIPNELPLSIDGVVQARQQMSLRTAETDQHFPTFETFRRNEQQFITFWRQWASTNVR